MELTARDVTVDKYGVRTNKSKLFRIPCVADGTNTTVQGEKGEKFLISYQVQLAKKPVVAPGDKINKLQTSQGDILFSEGVVRRVTQLINPQLGVIGQTLSVQVSN